MPRKDSNDDHDAKPADVDADDQLASPDKSESENQRSNARRDAELGKLMDATTKEKKND